MNKTELIDAVVKATGLKKKDAEAAVETKYSLSDSELSA